jgi:hypothetical protein
MGDREWGSQQRYAKQECGCRMCKDKHSMMFWTIVLLLLIIIVMLMKQLKYL